MSKENFLKDILGTSGHEALCNTASNSKELDNLIFTRSLLSWVDLVCRYGFSGNVPGQQQTMNIKKSEAGLSGYVEVSDKFFEFNDKDTSYVAAILAVALDADKPIKTPNTRSIIKLGKSIDCIVKTEFVAKNLAKALPPYHSPVKQGKPALPEEPLEQEPPEAIQPPAPLPKAGSKQGSSLGKKEKPKKSFIFKLKKHDLNARCDTCAKKLFDDKSFVGCLCYDNENVQLLKNQNEASLKFKPGTDSDFILALMETIENASQ